MHLTSSSIDHGSKQNKIMDISHIVVVIVIEERS